MDKTDVLIVGGGPVGLTLACELRLAGVAVTVLERRTERIQQSRALTIHGRTLEMLGLRGLADRFLSLGTKVPTGHFAVLDTRLDFSVFATRFPFTLFLPQASTERLLEELAIELGVDLRHGFLVNEVSQTTDSVSLQGLYNGKPIRLEAHYLVGADGARSVVRRQAGIDFLGFPATNHFCLGDVVLDNPPEKLVFSGFNAAGVLMVAPLGDNIHHRIVLLDAERGDTPLSEPVTLHELAASAIKISGIDFSPRAPIWLSRFSDETRMASSYRHGRLLLAGDAAHIHLPAGGQGMNVGMQDAMNLGWKLAAVVKGFASDELLESYHRERHPVGEALYQNTLAQTALLTRFDSRGLALRATVAALMKAPEANRQLASELSGFGVAYDRALSSPASSLSLATGWTGRRMPDWTLRMADGRESSAHRLLRPGKWVWLILDGNELSAGALPLHSAWVTTVFAQSPDAHSDLAGIAAILVRPDGYVDFAVARDKAQALSYG